MILPASYANGFAPRDGQPLYPSLWRGCVFAAAPGLGPTGLTLQDWSHNKAHGTLVNGASVLPIAGQYAANLDGSNDHCLFTPSTRVLNALNSNLYAVSVWCYVRSFANQPVIWTIQSASSVDSGLLMFNATGSILYAKSANNVSGLNNVRTYTLSTAVAINTWTHICFNKTGAGDNGNLYVNGLLQTSYSGTLGTCVVGLNHRIYYGIYTTIVPLNGAVDSMMIHDRPLTANEVSTMRSRRGIAHELAPRRRASILVPGFKAVWASRQRQIIGGGV